MRCFHTGQWRAPFSNPLVRSRLNSLADLAGKMRLRPSQMRSTLSVHIVSMRCPPGMKSMNILNSGMLLAMSCPSQLSMLPRVGFTLRLSRTSLAATSLQYCFSAVMMYPALPMMATPISVNATAMAK